MVGLETEVGGSGGIDIRRLSGAFLPWAPLAVFGLIIFPEAIAAGRHLFADGAYAAAKLFETGRPLHDTAAREMTHILRQGPAALALAVEGVSPRAVITTLGVGFYYGPLLFHALAIAWLLKAERRCLALLCCLAQILSFWTVSSFIMIESNFGFAVFLAIVARIVSASPRSWATIAWLVGLGALGTFTYEFTALLYAAALVVYVVRLAAEGAESGVGLSRARRNRTGRRWACLWGGGRAERFLDRSHPVHDEP